MKRILLAAAILFTTACDATTTVYKVECANPFKMTTDKWSEDRVNLFNDALSRFDEHRKTKKES